MGIDYKLFSDIDCDGEIYTSDYINKLCPLERIVSQKIEANADKIKIWLKGEASMGKTVSAGLLDQFLSSRLIACFRFPIKKLNYDQVGIDGDKSQYEECIERINELPENAFVILDGLDELRFDEIIIERAKKCIHLASEHCNVLVISRKGCNVFSTVLKEFENADMLMLSDNQINDYLENLVLGADAIQCQLLHIVLFLKIYKELILSGVSLNNKQLSEAGLLEQYFIFLYQEKGNVQEIKARRIQEFYRDIVRIGECIYEDIYQMDIYLGNTHWNGKYALHNVCGIPKILNDIYEETPEGSIDATNIRFLDFALGEYLCEKILLLWEKFSISESEAFVHKCQEIASVTTGHFATNGFCFAGELLAIRGEENEDIVSLMQALHDQVLIVARTPNLFALCCGYDPTFLDDIYGVGYAKLQMDRESNEPKEWLLARRNHIQEWINLLGEKGEYEGPEIDGLPEGKGIIRYSDTTYYYGEFHQGKKQGHGEMHYPDGSIYVGDWFNDEKNGNGKLTFPDGAYYDCEWKNNSKNGWGTFFSPLSQRSYEGFFSNGELDGFCKENIPGVMSFCGNRVDGHYHGIGCFEHFEHGEHFIYCGEYDHGLWNGHGVLYYERSCYQGEFKKCVRDGYGVQVLPNGDRYEGYWKNDKYHGKGKYYYFDSGEWFEGEFEDDSPKGTMVYHYPDGRTEEKDVDDE